MESLAVFAQAMHAQKIAVETAFAVMSAAQRCSREMLRGTLDRYPGLPPKEREHYLLFNDLCLEITAQCRLITAQGFEGARRLFVAPACRQEAAAASPEHKEAANASMPPATELRVSLPATKEVQATSANQASPASPLLLGPQAALEAEAPVLAPLTVAAGADSETTAPIVGPEKKEVANRSFTAAGKPRQPARRTRKKTTVTSSFPEEKQLERTEADGNTSRKQP